MHSVFLSLGTNLGDKKFNLEKAVQKIQVFSKKVVCFSSIYESEAWGYISASSFFNQCLEIECSLAPRALLSACKKIETEMGRTHRGEGYEDRIIDIDILFIDNEIIEARELRVPHPGISSRRFVLEPLHEIAPAFFHPVYQKTVAELLRECRDEGMVRRLVCE